MAEPKKQHIPVMLTEVLETLTPALENGGVLVDCTLGYGGHSEALSEKLTPDSRLIGVDRDENALAYCRTLFSQSVFETRFYQAGFEDLDEVLTQDGCDGADAILFDLGFSSPQIDTAQRGFSFMRSGPLDMRMDQRQVLTAREVVHTWSESELAGIFKRYGDERFSRRIAKQIVRHRQSQPIETTQELADAVLQGIPAKYQHQEGVHPATRVFQALRIVVNNEIEALRAGLNAALNWLNPGGRVAVLSYHSLEHRIVKELFRDYCGTLSGPPGVPQLMIEGESKGKLINRRAMTPCAAERTQNPRSRSAQLRVIARHAD